MLAGSLLRLLRLRLHRHRIGIGSGDERDGAKQPICGQICEEKPAWIIAVLVVVGMVGENSEASHRLNRHPGLIGR